MAETFSQGNVPWYTNTERQLEAKILNAIGGGGGGGGGISSGSGAPVAAPSSSPAFYIDETTGTIYSYYAGAWH